MGIHREFLLRLLCLPKRDINCWRCSLRRHAGKGRGARADALHRDAEGWRIGLSLRAVQEGWPRHCDASTLRGAGRAHDQDHGPNRGDQEKEVKSSAINDFEVPRAVIRWFRERTFEFG